MHLIQPSHYQNNYTFNYITKCGALLLQLQEQKWNSAVFIIINWDKDAADCSSSLI